MAPILQIKIWDNSPEGTGKAIPAVGYITTSESKILLGLDSIFLF